MVRSHAVRNGSWWGGRWSDGSAAGGGSDGQGLRVVDDRRPGTGTAGGAGLSITQLEFRRAGECGIPRIALLRTRIPDERLSDLQDPVKLARVMAFRAEVAQAVRPAEFSDGGGLIQGLSTGVQAAARCSPPPPTCTSHCGNTAS
jgi:hypothetical protein